MSNQSCLVDCGTPCMSAFEGTPSPPQCGRHKWKPPKVAKKAAWAWEKKSFKNQRYNCNFPKFFLTVLPLRNTLTFNRLWRCSSPSRRKRRTKGRTRTEVRRAGVRGSRCQLRSGLFSRLHIWYTQYPLISDTFWRLVQFLGKIWDRLVLGDRLTVTIDIFTMKLPY